MFMYLQPFFERFNLKPRCNALYVSFKLKALPTNSETLAFVLTLLYFRFQPITTITSVEKKQYKVQQFIFLPSLIF